MRATDDRFDAAAVPAVTPSRLQVEPPSLGSESPPATLFAALRQRLSVYTSIGPGTQTSGMPSAEACSLGRIQLLEIRGDSLTLEAEGSSNSPGVVALILLEGAARVRQSGREAALAAGDLCLLRTGRPLDLSLAGAFSAACVEAPEAEIADRFPLWRAAMVTPIPGDSGVSAVFCDAVRSMHRWRASLGGEGGERLADAVVDLMGALVCFAVPVNGECIRQSLYQKDQVKQAIQLNLRDPALSVESIAEFVGLSSRHLHRLFVDEGMSLMRWVWVQRLEQCYRDLTQGDTARRSISDIAYTWGFNDQSHFSRAFRKHFGVSPSAVRRQSLTAESEALTA